MSLLGCSGNKSIAAVAPLDVAPVETDEQTMTRLLGEYAAAMKDVNTTRADIDEVREKLTAPGLSRNDKDELRRERDYFVKERNRVSSLETSARENLEALQAKLERKASVVLSAISPSAGEESQTTTALEEHARIMALITQIQNAILQRYLNEKNRAEALLSRAFIGGGDSMSLLGGKRKKQRTQRKRRGFSHRS